jgi:hypothetical protein
MKKGFITLTPEQIQVPAQRGFLVGSTSEHWPRQAERIQIGYLWILMVDKTKVKL